MTTQEIRNSIASIYWSLNKDRQALWDQGDDREVFYDVGLCVAYCLSIDKHKLGDKIYDKFMED